MRQNYYYLLINFGNELLCISIAPKLQVRLHDSFACMNDFQK